MNADRLKWICVLDFEATCDDVDDFPHEIIEFPSVLLRWNDKLGNYEEVSRFQKYCRPKNNPTLSDFCVNLTGITQKLVDSGEWFPDVMNDHYQWLVDSVREFGENDQVEDVAILTCGMWDLEKMLPREYMNWNLVPPSKIYSRVINIKDSYKSAYGLEKGYGMARMLEHSGLKLEGRHHSGIDDCHNTARLVQKLVSMGYVYTELDYHYINTRCWRNHLRKFE